MRRLLEIELVKLASRELGVSAMVYAGLLPAAMAGLQTLHLEAPSGSAGGNLLAFPDVWANAAYVAGWIDYLMYVVVLQSIAQEYQWRTNRQNVLDGLTRTEYIVGKLALLLVASLASTVLVAVLAAGFGIAGGIAPGVARFTGFLAVPLYLLHVLGYLVLAFLIATIARRSGAAVVAFIGYTLVAEPLARVLVLPAAAARWLPSHAFASLVPNPLFGYVGMRTAAPALAPTVALALAWIAGLAVIASWRFARQDL
jgi:ABC-type transport system involved in multi-copper enzyme maturation permease subunit